jgi:hypothetical protein
LEIADGQVGEGLSNEPRLLSLGGGGALHNDGVDPHTRLSPDLEGVRASIGQGDSVGWPEREAPRGTVDAVPHAVGLALAVTLKTRPATFWSQ